MISTEPTLSYHHHGGRIASPAYREALRLSDSFLGLEEGVQRFDLLRLAKRVGRSGGFTPRLLQLLEYYVTLSRELDWRAGSRPLVYQSLSRTALELGVSERQIQKLEAGLFALGAIGFQDSPNHKRYGVRDPKTGRLKFGYGVDLSPLAFLRADLEAQLAAKQQTQQAWLAAKRAIGESRRQIRGLLAEGWQREEGASPVLESFAAAYASIAGPLRTHHSLAQLQSLLEQHQQLQRDLLKALELELAAPSSLTTEVGDRKQKTCGCSSTGEQMFMHREFTNPLQDSDCSPAGTGSQESKTPASALPSPIASAGLIHITLDMALSVATPEFATLLPIAPHWKDVVEAAYRRAPELGITPKDWGEGCRVLGRTGAALCLVVTDRKRTHPTQPVRLPAAYFRGLMARAERGELRLERSVFGLLNDGRPPISHQLSSRDDASRTPKNRWRSSLSRPAERCVVRS